MRASSDKAESQRGGYDSWSLLFVFTDLPISPMYFPGNPHYHHMLPLLPPNLVLAKPV